MSRLWQPRSAVRRHASEAARLIRAAGSDISSHLRVRTKWSCFVGPSIRHVGGTNAVRSLALLDPCNERGKTVESVGTGSSRAVVHAGNHEQPVKILRIR